MDSAISNSIDGGMLDPDVMIGELEDLIATLKDQWAYVAWNRERVGLDLGELLGRYRSLLEKTLPYSSYFDILHLLAAELQDGHVSAMEPKGKLKRLAAVVPASFSFYGGQLYIKELTEPASWDPAPCPGDRMISVNDRPIASVIAWASARTPASTRRHLLAQIASDLVIPLDDGDSKLEAAITVEKPDGKYVEVRVLLGQRSLDTPTPLTVEWLNDGLVHMKIGSFTPADWFSVTSNNAPVVPGDDPRIPACVDMIDQAFSEVQRAETLVLDLRGNRGGTDTLGEHVARHLLPPGFTYFHLSARHSEKQARQHLAMLKQMAQRDSLPGASPKQVRQLQKLDLESADPTSFGLPTSGWSPPMAWKPEPQRGADPFKGRVVLLTDSLCFSAADNFIACIQDQLPNVFLMGTGTGGGTGAPRPMTLSHTKGQFTFCTMRVYRPNGGLIEGIGSEPDMAVAPTPNDLRAHRDRVLEAALDLFM